MATTRPGKPCGSPGCRNMILSGQRFCDIHTKKDKQDRDKRRGSSKNRGYDKNWKKLRAVKASISPLCELCLAENRVVPLDCVHHLKPVDKFPELRLDLDNLQSLCYTHHLAVHKDILFGNDKR